MCTLALAMVTAVATSAQTLTLDLERANGRVTARLLSDQPLMGPAFVQVGNSVRLKVPTGTPINNFISPASAGFTLGNRNPDACSEAGVDAFLLTPVPSGQIIPTGVTLPADTPLELFSFDLPSNPICVGDIALADPNTDPCVPGSANAQPTATFFSRVQLVSLQAGGLLETSGLRTGMVPCDPNTPVPVELAYFTAAAVDETSVLAWRTATESGNAGFEVQRNTLGSDWEVIGWVDGQGTSREMRDYTFVDDSPANGINYYRLRQVDYDGTDAHSDLVSTSFVFETDIRVYPNPSQGNFQISLPDIPTGELSLRVADVSGRVVYERVIPDAAFTKYDLELQHLAAGSYQLKLVSSLGQATERLVIAGHR